MCVNHREPRIDIFLLLCGKALRHALLFFQQGALLPELIDLCLECREFIFRQRGHRREDFDVEQVFHNLSTCRSRQPHERHIRRAAEHDDLEKALVVHADDVLFQHRLIIRQRRGLRNHVAVLMNLKDVRFDAALDVILVVVDGEPEFRQRIAFVDGVHQRGLVDIAQRPPKQGKRHRFRHGGLACTITTDNQRGGVPIQRNLDGHVAGGEKVLIANLVKDNHLLHSGGLRHRHGFAIHILKILLKLHFITGDGQIVHVVMNQRQRVDVR